jgi:hypothetical protein
MGIARRASACAAFALAPGPPICEHVGKARSISHFAPDRWLSGWQSLAIYRSMLKRRLPVGFVVPAQPVEREKPPTGAEWIHEIKHDGYRMIVRKEGEKSGFTTAKRSIGVDGSPPSPEARRFSRPRASPLTVRP